MPRPKPLFPNRVVRLDTAFVAKLLVEANRLGCSPAQYSRGLHRYLRPDFHWAAIAEELKGEGRNA